MAEGITHSPIWKSGKWAPIQSGKVWGKWVGGVSGWVNCEIISSPSSFAYRNLFPSIFVRLNGGLVCRPCAGSQQRKQKTCNCTNSWAVYHFFQLHEGTGGRGKGETWQKAKKIIHKKTNLSIFCKCGNIISRPPRLFSHTATWSGWQVGFKRLHFTSILWAQKAWPDLWNVSAPSKVGAFQRARVRIRFGGVAW